MYWMKTGGWREIESEGTAWCEFYRGSRPWLGGSRPWLGARLLFVVRAFGTWEAWRCFERSAWLNCSGAERERPARQLASPEVIREMEHTGDFSPVEHVVWLASAQDWFGRCGGGLLHIFWPAHLGACAGEINGDDVSGIFFPASGWDTSWIPTRR